MRVGWWLFSAAVGTIVIFCGSAPSAFAAIMFDSQNRFVTRLAHNDPLFVGVGPPPSTTTLLDTHAADFGPFSAGTALPPGGAGQVSSALGTVISLLGSVYLPVNPTVGLTRIQWESDQSHF